MRQRNSIYIRLVLMVFLVLAFAAGANRAAFAGDEKPWFPIKLMAWYGEYDPTIKGPDGKAKELELAAPSLGEMKTIEWIPPKAEKPWKIGVVLTHLKDPFWLTVNEGFVKEAERLGVELRVLDAGGYDQLTRQQEQVENLVSMGMDGIILCSIHYTGNDAIIKEVAKRGIPIISDPQDVYSPHITAKVNPSYAIAGYTLLDWFLGEIKGQKGIKVIWLPGPAGASWSEPPYFIFEKGLKEKGIGPDQVEILDVKWGDAGMDVQLPLIESALQRHPKVDYVMGCAPAAEAAIRALSETGRAEKTKVVSTYITPPLLSELEKGKLAFATYDQTKIWPRVGIDLMVAILQGEKAGKDVPFRIETYFMKLTPEIIKAEGLTYDDFFAPKSWQPVMKVSPK